MQHQASPRRSKRRLVWHVLFCMMRNHMLSLPYIKFPAREIFTRLWGVDLASLSGSLLLSGIRVTMKT